MNTKIYKYILFDWDGCLAKTLNIWLSAYKTVYAEYGVYPTDLEITHHFGDWEGPKYFGITNVEECINKLDALASTALEKVELYEGAKEALDKLKKTKKLALLTSSPREIIQRALAHNHLSDYFSVILTAEDVTKHKPDPEVVEKGLQLLNGNRSESILVGDSRKDIGAANNAGIDSALFYPSTHSLFYSFDELKQYNPTYIFGEFGELFKLLNYANSDFN